MAKIKKKNTACPLNAILLYVFEFSMSMLDMVGSGYSHFQELHLVRGVFIVV